LRAAVKQSHANGIVKIGDGLRHRGLGGRKLGRRLGHAAVLRNAGEDFINVDIHRYPSPQSSACQQTEKGRNHAHAN
jgi:hypothetical protein